MSDLTLGDGEVRVRSFRANRCAGNRVTGGSLHLTDQRLVFCPRRMDAAIGGRGWETSRAAVSSVDIAPRGLTPFAGCLRKRLRIATAKGTEYFVVRELDEVAGYLAAALAHS